jgi:HSP20 family molecular chaperone IbpA
MVTWWFKSTSEDRAMGEHFYFILFFKEDYMYFNLAQVLPYVTYSFSRPMQESEDSYTIEQDGKLIVYINALGISKEDIGVHVEVDPENPNKQYLIVKGKTHNDILDRDFGLTWKRYSMTPIDTVDPKLENGLLKLEITFKTPVKPDVKINSL